MKMIVGLGNPGNEYDNTRHNIGYMVIDDYAKKKNVSGFQKQFNGLYTKCFCEGISFLLVKPLSFINLSGSVVKKFADYYKINNEDIFVIQDDLYLPLGKIKIKSKGSSGGHNGIKNIIEELKTDDFSRFKIGIDKNNDIETVDYVLGHFNQEELKKIHKVLEISQDIIDDFVKTDINYVMNKYNGVEHEN